MPVYIHHDQDWVWPFHRIHRVRRWPRVFVRDQARVQATSMCTIWRARCMINNDPESHPMFLQHIYLVLPLVLTTYLARVIVVVDPIIGPHNVIHRATMAQILYSNSPMVPMVGYVHIDQMVYMVQLILYVDRPRCEAVCARRSESHISVTCSASKPAAWPESVSVSDRNSIIHVKHVHT